MDTPSAVPTPRGRQTRRLTTQFQIGTLRLEERLPEHLLRACGVASAANWALGNALQRHSSGIYGPIPKPDRLLNDYLLDQKVLPRPPHYVVSLQPAGPLWLRISTYLPTGHTTVRWSPAPSPKLVTPTGEARDET